MKRMMRGADVFMAAKYSTEPVGGIEHKPEKRDLMT